MHQSIEYTKEIAYVFVVVMDASISITRIERRVEAISKELALTHHLAPSS